MFCAGNTNNFLDQIVIFDKKWILYNICKRLGQWFDCDESNKHFPKVASAKDYGDYLMLFTTTFQKQIRALM